jgi:hypothetical protein
MMRRRSVGRRVVRTAATTAVVVGTAGAVSHHQQQKYANKEAAAQDQYDAAYQQGAAEAGPDLTAQLQQLAQLHDSGILTDEEFASAKQKLLAG